MKSLEKIIVTGMLVIMATVLLVNSMSVRKEKPFDIPNTPDVPNPEIKWVQVYLDMGNGYYIKTNIANNILTIGKSDANTAIEITTETQPNISTQWVMETISSWDPNPETAPIGNVSKIFRKNSNGKSIRVELIDYEGGKYSQEMEKLIEEIKFP
ncbi:hypothetical protein HOF67_02530 [Candidatus Peregrinibacteria bacterium]|jgi:hypothetical protein|nr:hypothetical protein [Candidatus Peregrinibacteria bacterium]